jgi:phage FluMu protein Com
MDTTSDNDAGARPTRGENSAHAPNLRDIRELEDMRCRECQRLLLRVQHRALRPGCVLEIQCRCKALNYLVGTLCS